jgi:hypothetical protein
VPTFIRTLRRPERQKGKSGQMTTNRQLIWTIFALATFQLVGQLLPSFGMFIGTPLLVPITTIIICFALGEKTTRFDFEIKSIIVISATVFSAVMDYFYAPGTHDQAGVAWMTMLWSYGLFVLFFGLIGAKFYFDFSVSKFGFNIWTALTIIELVLFISIPFIYHRLVWSGQIFFSANPISTYSLS